VLRLYSFVVQVSSSSTARSPESEERTSIPYES
jgi:hypothetical protein